MSSEGEPTGAVSTLEARVEALSRNLMAVEEELEETKAELAREREARIEGDETNQERIAEVEQQTDLLSLVDEADVLRPKQKAGILIQNLHRKAKKKQQKGRKPQASLDREGAENVLQNIEQDRTTFYTDMERAARMVGADNDVLRYESKPSGSILVLNLEKGQLPGSVDGVKLHADANGGR